MLIICHEICHVIFAMPVVHAWRCPWQAIRVCAFVAAPVLFALAEALRLHAQSLLSHVTEQVRARHTSLTLQYEQVTPQVRSAMALQASKGETVMDNDWKSKDTPHGINQYDLKLV